jgi:hypothetical protein
MKIHCTLLVFPLGVILCSGVQVYRMVLVYYDIHEYSSVYVNRCSYNYISCLLVRQSWAYPDYKVLYVGTTVHHLVS